MDESMYKETVLNALAAVNPLSEPLKDSLRSVLKIERFGKGQLLLKSGSICDRMHFIVKGAIHCYYGTKEKPGTVYFMIETQIAISKASYYQQKKSKQNIEALEETITVSILKVDLDRLYKEYKEFNINGRILTEYYNEKSDIKALILQLRKPAERYNLFKEKFPRLAERVSGKLLAGFLGMRKETLSRIVREEKKIYVNRTRKKDINIDPDQSEHCK